MKLRELSIGVALAIEVLGSGCIDTGQAPVSFPLKVAGTANTIVTTRNGTSIELSSARLAFGPLYLCPGASAGDLCETARAQWLQTTVVDALDPTIREVGQISGLSGVVQSWMYDLGISSQLSRSEPFVLEAARELGGASLQIRGRAQVEGVSLPFFASVKVQQSEDTELGVPVVRKSLSDPFFRDLGAGPDQLLVRFDPAAWLLDLDLSEYIEQSQCEAQSAALVCDGTLERRCQGATQLSQRDCALAGQVCIAGQGCVQELVMTPKSQAYRALRSAALGGVRPAMQWIDDLLLGQSFFIQEERS